jgi:hypothetical protein
VASTSLERANKYISEAVHPEDEILLTVSFGFHTALLLKIHVFWDVIITNISDGHTAIICMVWQPEDYHPLKTHVVI